MKAFIIALTVLLLTVGGCIFNDLYCHAVCEDITENVAQESAEGAKKALDIFKRNDFLLSCSVDTGYLSEARVSLESLLAAHECNDEYEIKRYVYDVTVRTNRIKRALFI